MNSKQDITARQIQAVTYLGIAVSVFLVIIKMAVGLAVSSLAMSADAVNPGTMDYVKSVIGAIPAIRVCSVPVRA